MSPKAASNKETQLTAREMEVLAIAWQCLEGSPKVNYAQLARRAPFKNATTARSCFAPIRKKLSLALGGLDGAKIGEPGTPTKGGGKRKAGAQKTPGSGKKAKATGKTCDVSLKFEEEDDDEDEANAKIKAALKTDIDVQEEYKEDVEGVA
ncbi:hypothetical protein F5Y11DRAFT_331564 [Daldinia sp. FL1419]|nr:hypothetical protein F5Y11DRAFT_331564 [Daldinia sp. FL1419]